MDLSKITGLQINFQPQGPQQTLVMVKASYVDASTDVAQAHAAIKAELAGNPKLSGKVLTSEKLDAGLLPERSLSSQLTYGPPPPAAAATAPAAKTG